MTKIKITDTLGRPVMEIADNRIAVGRLDGLSKEETNHIYEVYREISGDTSERISDFLHFSTEEDEFCS